MMSWLSLATGNLCERIERRELELGEGLASLRESLREN
jgi:hypothetical protein